MTDSGFDASFALLNVPVTEDGMEMPSATLRSLSKHRRTNIRTSIDKLHSLAQQLDMGIVAAEMNAPKQEPSSAPVRRGNQYVPRSQEAVKLTEWKAIVNQARTELRHILATQNQLSTVADRVDEEKVQVLRVAELAPKTQITWMNPDGLLTSNNQRTIVEKGQKVEAFALNGTGEIPVKRRQSLLAGLPQGKAAMSRLMNVGKGRGRNPNGPGKAPRIPKVGRKKKLATSAPVANLT